MKLSYLRDVLAVAEAGSLRGAGRLLGITQPSITRSIREIERELGAPLFERHASGVRLTLIGEAFIRRAGIVQSELRRAREEVEQLKGNFTGQASIALTAGSAIALLPTLLPLFRKRFPDALLKIAEGMFQLFERDITSGEIDFFVGPLDEALTSTNLLVEKIFENSRHIICRRGHPLAGATSLRALAAAQWIRPSFGTNISEADFAAMFARENLPQPKIALHTRSALMTLLAIANSDMLTVLPRQWLELPATAGLLQVIALPGQLHSAPICLIRRGDVPLTPVAEALCDLVHKIGRNYGKR